MIEKKCLIFVRCSSRFALLLSILGWSMILNAQVSMSAVFGDHMILQRGIEIPLWGKTSPGTVVSVRFSNFEVITKADTSGHWRLRLPEFEAGGPYTLEVYGENQQQPTIVFEDVLVGDVWFASGQSNMELEVQQSMNADEEIANANYQHIRFFNVAHAMSPSPREDIIDGKWLVCDTASVKKASAAAYFFAREIHTEINVPVGIVQASWGGTPVEAWTSREQLLSSDLTRNIVLANDSLADGCFEQDSLNLIRFWDIVYNPHNNIDQIIPLADFDDSVWNILNMPGTFKDWNWPYYEGIVWMRKKVIIPEAMAGEDLTIHLGQPEMNYSLYFNGAEICKTIWNAEPTHHYILPAALVNEGENTIAVRMAVLWGGGGFNPPAENMFITDGKSKVSIDGEWKYRKDLESEIPKLMNFHRYHSFLYNAMVHPVIPFGIKGFLWYQGEDNTTDAFNYRHLFPMMINDWRIRWKQGYLPFLYVQLANFRERPENLHKSDWALLRESQTKTLMHPNTGMACAIDIGDPDDIHPTNKQEVGRRLALIAFKQVYGKDVVANGPMLKDFSIKDQLVELIFETYGSSLTKHDNAELKGFMVAGEDQEFYEAMAVIKNNSIVVSSKDVVRPVAVRYAWADNPLCNLTNKEGLPALPFRTDDWNNKMNK
jgi:sialate O-acetylesterase